MDSICSGMGGDLSSIEQLGIPVDPVDCCEHSQVAMNYLLNNHFEMIRCARSRMLDLSDRKGYCFAHGTEWCPGSQRGGSRTRKDLCVAGPPCQPYTPYVSGHCSQHSLYECVFGYQRYGGLGQQAKGDSVIDFVQDTGPRGLLVEQVEGFLKKASGELLSPGDMFVQHMMNLDDPWKPGFLYSAYHIFRVHQTCMTVARPR